MIVVENNKHVFAKKLKHLRITSFISQKNMAKKFKISQQAYAKLENGKVHFTIKKIEKICKIFNIEHDDFITINSKSRKTKNPDSQSIKILKKYYQRKLLEKEIRIGELELEIIRLTKGKRTGKPSLDVHVMI